MAAKTDIPRVYHNVPAILSRGQKLQAPRRDTSKECRIDRASKPEQTTMTKDEKRSHRNVEMISIHVVFNSRRLQLRRKIVHHGLTMASPLNSGGYVIRDSDASRLKTDRCRG